MDTTHRIVRLILRFAAVATFILGGITLFFPDLVVEISDGYSTGNYHLVRFIGTALIGFGITNWFYSTFEDLKVTLPAIYGNITSLSLAILVDAYGLVAGRLRPTAWIILCLHIFFCIAFIKCVLLIRHADLENSNK
jgi:Na+-driven multidrug efflux pump